MTHEVVRPSGENKVLNLDVPTSWEPQETVRVTFDGFAPGSEGAVWIYPDGMVAGTAPLDGGSGSVLVQRPSGISGKDHRIIATATSKSGDEIAVAYGLTVVTEGSASGWSRWLLIALACAVVAALLIPAVRRRTGKRPVLAGVDNDVTYVGIYNADGSLLGEISYVLAKYTGRGHCELCDITHGTFRRKRSWDKACEQAGINMELLHRDEATTDQLNAAGDLPAIIKVDGNTWRLVAGPAELAACDGNPERLMTLLTTS